MKIISSFFFFFNFFLCIFSSFSLLNSLSSKNKLLSSYSWINNQLNQLQKYQQNIENSLSFLKNKERSLPSIPLIVQGNQELPYFCRLTLEQITNNEKLISPCGCSGTQKVSFSLTLYFSLFRALFIILLLSNCLFVVTFFFLVG